MALTNKTVVLVLGMHRSGTSLITRSLKSLGVELGENLLPPVEGHNDKGYWEDKEFNAINMALLSLLDIDWHTLTVIEDSEFRSNTLESVRNRALGFLREKSTYSTCFGLKDPRASILLPFWKSVFLELGLNVKYIITCRNPLSVASSLSYPHEIKTEKSLFLWFIYSLKSLKHSDINNCLVVSYERMMQEPHSQITRLASFLDLHTNERESEISQFTNEFLDKRLQHNAFTIDDVKNKVPGNIVELYLIMRKLAEDKAKIDNINIQNKIKSCFDYLNLRRDSFSWINSYENELTNISSRLSAELYAHKLSKTHINNIETLNVNQKVELVDAKIQHKTAQQEIVNLSGENESAQQEIVKLSGANESSQQDIVKLSGENESFQQEIVKLIGENESAQQEIVKLSGENESSQQDIVKLSGESESFQQEIVKLIGENESAQQEIVKLSGENESSQQEIVKLSGESESFQQEIVKLIGEDEFAQQEIVKLSGENKSAQQEIVKLSGENESSQQEIVKLSGENESFQQEIVKLIGEDEFAQQEIVKLSGENKSAQQEIVKLSGENESSQQEIVKLSGENESSQQEIVKLSGENEFAQQEIVKLSYENKSAQQEIVKLSGANESSQQEIVKLSGENEFAQQEIVKLSDENKSAQQEIVKLSSENETGHQKLSVSGKQLALKQSEVVKLEEVLKEMENSMLWKMCSPLRWFYVFSITLTNYLKKATRLTNFKIHNLELIKGSYVGDTDDPHVVFTEPLDNYNFSKWLYIEVDADFKTENPSPSIYIDCGDGYNENNNYLLTVTNKKCFGTFLLDSKINQIRWDPDNKDCCFHFTNIKIKKITKINAVFSRFKEFRVKQKLAGLSAFQSYLAVCKGVVNGNLKRAVADLDSLDFDSTNMIENKYLYWIENIETSTRINDKQISQEIESFKIKPKISVVIPTYNTEEKYLRKCLDSVTSQSYSNWELCIADDNSPSKKVQKILEEYVNKYQNIKVVYRNKNGHICNASNSALELVTGDYIALLDHDDELAKNALFLIAKAINENPKLRIIYTDEDKIDERGERFNPHFKSGFNLDLLYSQNYISHLGVYQTSLVKRVGGFRVGYEGSQDYDLLLRCVAKVTPEAIKHLPHILYHWRAIQGSTALAADEKSYTTDAGIRALNSYFDEKKENVTVEKGLLDNTYKVNWILESEPLVSLIIPTYNGYEITKQAIDSILAKTTYKNYEILLVNNNSDCNLALKYFESIARHSKITVLNYPFDFNYSAINNFAVDVANGEIIGLINNDVEVISPGWLTEMVSQAARPEIGCVGAKLYYAEDKIQHAGVILGIGGVAGHSHKHYDRDAHGYFSRLKLIQNYSAVTAAALVIQKSVFNEVGGLNDKDLTIAFNDIDFCLKVQKAGYRNLWTPYAELYHHESISRGAEDSPKKIKRFNKEVDYMLGAWSEILNNDPYYNRNLTLRHEDFSTNTDGL
jgi:glycosyltransferase involved in cell wall biosynthesis